MTVVSTLDPNTEPSIPEPDDSDRVHRVTGMPSRGESHESRYLPIRLLGAGGMGQVWLADDVVLDRQVAIKMLKPEFSATRQARERFLAEAKNGAKLRHPNIVVVHDVGGGNEPYIIQEYVEGEDLGTIVGRHPRGLPMHLVLTLGVQLAHALEAAHRVGVVHRDVKPANIMVSEGCKAKLGDFGLSEVVDSIGGRRHGWIGTLPYLPPEQVWDRADASADCYALGIVLYEISTGSRPFDGGTAEEIVRKRRFEDPKPPIVLRFDLPADVNDLIMELLHRNPAQRPSAAEVGARLSSPGPASR